MKIKQIVFTVLISGITSLGVMYGYDHFNEKPAAIQDGVKIPTNYAGMFDSNNNVPGNLVDFEQPAKAALPAVVHITTVIGKAEVSNNLPRRSNPFQGLVPDDFFDDFLAAVAVRCVLSRSGHQARE